MDFSGSQQTCYSDWGRTVLEFFPDPKFSLNGERVHVFWRGEEVGYYDFGTGRAFLKDGFPIHPPSVVGNYQSFTPIDIDSFIQ